MELLLLIGSAVVVYVTSAWLHPYVKCEACDGKGQHAGALFSYATRPCHRCSGTGLRRRFTATLIGVGKRRKTTSRFQKSTSSFKDTNSA
jgi:DnaJ-class molecular chaperone